MPTTKHSSFKPNKRNKSFPNYNLTTRELPHPTITNTDLRPSIYQCSSRSAWVTQTPHATPGDNTNNSREDTFPAPGYRNILTPSTPTPPSSPPYSPHAHTSQYLMRHETINAGAPRDSGFASLESRRHHRCCCCCCTHTGNSHSRNITACAPAASAQGAPARSGPARARCQNKPGQQKTTSTSHGR